MKKSPKERGQKMFSLLLPIEDFAQLESLKKNMRFTTTQQAVKYLLYNPVTLLDAENLTPKHENTQSNPVHVTEMQNITLTNLNTESYESKENARLQ